MPDIINDSLHFRFDQHSPDTSHRSYQDVTTVAAEPSKQVKARKNEAMQENRQEAIKPCAQNSGSDRKIR